MYFIHNYSIPLR